VHEGSWCLSQRKDVSLLKIQLLTCFLEPIEILGIIQGRKWNVAGLNEFRKHFGLKAHETFEDINSDPEVANNLRNLYDHPDFVELYPGIVAEEAK
jgi:hypothetical protein